MNIYDIAGLKVGLDCQPRTMRQAEKYLIPDFQGEPDIIINPSLEEIGSFGDGAFTPEQKAHIHEGKLFYQALIQDFSGMMIHSSAIVVDERAYLFSATSGTGKSTHTGLWMELFGDKAYILNDDKPAVRIVDDVVYAYGTPWSGKVDMSVNKAVKLAGICFLQRDTENWIRPMANQDIIVNMYQASIRKLSPENVIKLMDIINGIAARVPIYQMGCNPTIDAAKMSYEAMSKGL